MMIYLDNSATTAITAPVAETIARTTEIFGNPSSVHAVGLAAAQTVREARRQVEDALSVPAFLRVDDRLPIGAGARNAFRFFFTSCGSESDNTAVFGLLHAKKFRELPRIITTDSEHPAMLEAISAAKRLGLCESVLLPTVGGVVDTAALDAALTPNTLLVSVMTVNNETGAVYDIRNIFRRVKARVPGAICHTDAVQGFLKLDFPFARSGADLVSISGHKLGAPKGIGGLLVSNELLVSKRIVPLVYGGGQESGLRSGTENVIGIAALGAACDFERSRLSQSLAKMHTLRELFAARIGAVGSGARINTPPVCAEHIISLTLPRVRSETLVRALSNEGICISNGSACSSHGSHRKKSVLEAFGLSADEADSTVRISLCPDNSESDVIAAADAIAENVNKLAHK